ncbi:cupin domain-containing protein [uncultured Pseudokineococcus sp.]|uniref:cupin domain-containing protein n=1 Tax=uncultured Pseudokineococcus sp. TaxID=1642928 RepID=UPI002627354F|nr:cupin domain-containing protein [uncultured Pseudokineococcus sp.]
MDRTSLTALARDELDRARTAPAQRSARTVSGGSGHLLRQTAIALLSGASLSEHRNPGEATVQVLLGRVRMTAGDDAGEAAEGELLAVPDAVHALEALEDSVVLLTVAEHEQVLAEG